MEIERCHFKRNLLFLPLIVLISSCLTIKEDTYVDTTYDDLIKKKGQPSYSINQTIGSEHIPYDFEPDFSSYFSKEELENSVVVKYASWQKRYSTLLVWFKCIDGTWIVFSSTEHKGPSVQ